VTDRRPYLRRVVAELFWPLAAMLATVIATVAAFVSGVHGWAMLGVAAGAGGVLGLLLAVFGDRIIDWWTDRTWLLLGWPTADKAAASTDAADNAEAGR
jgi:hypothetical protein